MYTHINNIVLKVTIFVCYYQGISFNFMLYYIFVNTLHFKSLIRKINTLKFKSRQIIENKF